MRIDKKVNTIIKRTIEWYAKHNQETVCLDTYCEPACNIVYRTITKENRCICCAIRPTFPLDEPSRNVLKPKEDRLIPTMVMCSFPVYNKPTRTSGKTRKFYRLWEAMEEITALSEMVKGFEGQKS